MSVKTAQTLAFVFYTYHPETGALCDADSTPVCTLYVSGVADAATVTVTNLATGKYKGSLTMPTLSTAGVRVSIGAAATVAGVASAASVFSDEVDSARPGEVYTRIGAPAGASVSADIAALPTDEDVNAQCDQAIADAAIPAGVRTELETELGRIDENVSAAKTLTSDYDAAKTAAQAGDAMTLTAGERTTLVAAVWNALTSGLTTVGSIGKLIVQKLGLIGVGTISVTSTTQTNGDWLPLIAGDDYLGTSSTRALAVTTNEDLSDVDASTGVVCNFGSVVEGVACTVTGPDEDGYYTVTIDHLTAAQTATMGGTTQRREFEAYDSGGLKATFGRANVTILSDTP